MNNKKIKITNKKLGSFTTIDLDLLFDKNLTANAKILLFAILSDSDSFELSQSLYCKRLGWEKNQFTRAIEQLEKHGYVKRTRIENDKAIPGKKKKGSTRILYFYTVSEYGNLNNEETTEVKSGVKTSTPPSSEELNVFVSMIRENIFIESAFNNIDEQLLEGFESNKEVFDRVFSKVQSESKEIQKLYVGSVIDSLKDFKSDKYPLSLKNKMNDKIKQVVYKENRTFNPASFPGASDEAQAHWQILRSDYNKKQNSRRIDPETAALND